MFALPASLGTAFKPTVAAGNITSIQQVSISFTGASGTASISAVNTANAVIFWGGATATQSNIYGETSRVTLTNSTTVTASVNTNAGGTKIVKCTVVEFSSSFVKTVQYGTVTLTAATSNTATISSVSTANSFVLYLGATTSWITDDDWAGETQSAVTLTNATTVTGFRSIGSDNVTISFVVVECQSGIISNVQKVTDLYNSSNLTDTKTITSVTTANSFIAFGGNTTAATGNDTDNSRYTTAITNSTTVTNTRGATAGPDRTPYYTVVSFVGGILASAPQQSTIVLNNVSSNTATISSVSTSKAFVIYTGSHGASANFNRTSYANVLTNSTTVTATTGVTLAASTNVSGFVVLEFV